MYEDDIRSGEVVVRNCYGDVVQRCEVIEFDTEFGSEAIMNPVPTLRKGDSITWTTKRSLNNGY